MHKSKTDLSFDDKLFFLMAQLTILPRGLFQTPISILTQPSSNPGDYNRQSHSNQKHSFNIETENLQVPQTNIGDSSVACNPGSSPRVTKGFATYFSDNTYACQRWNNKAKSLPDCFVAINGVCGMRTGTFCDQCVNIRNVNGQQQKCRVIDFCDPKNCDFLDPGHLDILNNNGNAHYRFADKGQYVTPYPGAGGQPIITWSWTSC